MEGMRVEGHAVAGARQSQDNTLNGSGQSGHRRAGGFGSMAQRLALQASEDVLIRRPAGGALQRHRRRGGAALRPSALRALPVHPWPLRACARRVRRRWNLDKKHGARIAAGATRWYARHARVIEALHGRAAAPIAAAAGRCGPVPATAGDACAGRLERRARGRRCASAGLRAGCRCG